MSSVHVPNHDPPKSCYRPPLLPSHMPIRASLISLTEQFGSKCNTPDRMIDQSSSAPTAPTRHSHLLLLLLDFTQWDFVKLDSRLKLIEGNVIKCNYYYWPSRSRAEPFHLDVLYLQVSREFLMSFSLCTKLYGRMTYEKRGYKFMTRHFSFDRSDGKFPMHGRGAHGVIPYSAQANAFQKMVRGHYVYDVALTLKCQLIRFVRYCLSFSISFGTTKLWGRGVTPITIWWTVSLQHSQLNK